MDEINLSKISEICQKIDLRKFITDFWIRQ